MIKKIGSKFVLYTRNGKRRLGTHSSRKGALKQEAAIKISKHKNDH